MTTPLTLFDIVALAVCIWALWVYHAYFYYNTIRLDRELQLSYNMRNIAHWVHKHKEKSDPQSTTLAIQTLRNTMMVGIFVGGYSLNFAYSVVNEFEPGMTRRKQVRNIILSVLLFCSFLCWATVIRHASHLGYLIGTLDYVDKLDMEIHERMKKHSEHTSPSGTVSANSDDVKSEFVGSDLETGADSSPRTRHRAELYEDDRKVVIKKAEHILQRMLMFFSLGFRFLFVAIPFAFYIAGPLGLVIATAVILMFTYSYDFHSFGPLTSKDRLDH